MTDCPLSRFLKLSDDEDLFKCMFSVEALMIATQLKSCSFPADAFVQLQMFVHWSLISCIQVALRSVTHL